MAVKTMKYNPAFMGDEKLIESFVGREAELDLILETIQENTGDSNHHVLVIGPRGIGKSTLVLRVAAEIRSNPDLQSRWFPLVYGEESYTVGSPGEFWLEALFHLGEQTGDVQWQDTYEELRTETDESRLRDRALSQLMDFADGQGKRILLVVENLNMLIGGQMSSDDAWTLRHTLINEPRVMLLGTTTSKLKWGTLRRGDKKLPEDYDQALYELFNVIELEPFAEEDSGALWQDIAGTTPVQMRPFQILTGGNPRLIRIISEFAAKTSFRDLMTNLTWLIDEHTEYFKNHIEVLPPQERKIFVALADLWDPATARRVAETTRLNVNKASALLNRLVERGAVSILDDRGRTKSYQVAERLYNIYHLMRRRGKPSSRVHAVVRFMINFYEGEELVQTTLSIVEEAGALPPEQRQEHLLAYEAILEMTQESELKNRIMEQAEPLLADLSRMPSYVQKLIEFLQEMEVGKTSISDEKIDALIKRSISEVEEIETLLKLGDLIRKFADRLKEAEALYEKALKIAPQNKIVWLDFGIFLGDNAFRPEEALEAFDKAIEINPNYAIAWNNKGVALGDLHRYEEALEAFDKAIEINPNYAIAWNNKGLALGDLHRYEEALEAFDKAIEINPNYAIAWNNKGLALGDLHRYEEALEAFDKAIEINPNYADVWYNKGNVLQKLHRPEEAIEAYDKAIEINPNYADACHNRGLTLWNLGRHKEAIEAYDKTIAIEPNSADAWNNKGNTLWSLGRHKEAIRAYDKTIAIEPNHSNGWYNKGMLLININRYKEAQNHIIQLLKKEELISFHLDMFILMFVWMAARGYAAEMLEIIQASPSAELLETMSVALQMYQGDQVDIALEIQEVAKDVVAKIEVWKER